MMTCAMPTGIATMIEPTMTRQKTIRDRASAARDVTGRPDSRPPRIDAAIAWLSTAATSSPQTGDRCRAARTSRRAPTRAVVCISRRVWWIATTSSAKLATANGPTVPRTMSPM